MNQNSPLIRWTILIVVGVLIAMTAGMVLNSVFLPVYDPQCADMAEAKNYLERLNPLIHANNRFDNIKALPYTGQGGSICIDGLLASDADLTDLHKIVERNSPPVLVVWKVIISPNPSTMPPTTSPTSAPN